MRRERGFALLAVLWVVVALGTIGVRAIASSRAGLDRVTDRLGAAQARWAAEACLAVALERLSSRAMADPFRLGASDTLRLANGSVCTMEAVDPAGAGDSILSDGRINVNFATDSALRTVAGIDDATLATIRQLRSWGYVIGSMADLAAHLPPSARQAMNEQWRDMSSRLVFRTSSLVVSARGTASGAGPNALVEVHVVPVVRRVAILRRRLT